MDGVPELTQAVVPPGAEFLYEFDVPDAGTYWYHPHNRTWEQMARGLYGALIVEENEPPVADRDEVLLIDDWRLQPDASVAGGFDAMMDWSHGGRMGNWLTVNGKGEYRQQARRGERLRLRLVNVANARIFPLNLDGLEGWVVALDGQPLARPEPVGRMVLAPAQRIDILVDVVAADGAAASINFLSGNDIYPLARFDIDGRARDKRLAPPRPLAPNPVSALGDIGAARKVTLRMEGGAMGGMRGAMMGGRMMGMRNLVENGRVWAFNGVADMSDAPLLAASRGETVTIDMVNDTAWPHAIHLHGHHFRKIAKNGEQGPLRDTLLVDSEETAKIAFVADNPGKWLLHCHMLEHAAGGMMTWIDVTA
jgi:FtsP/CotA-like multicopper oxidase with cupredoxin domain